VTKILTQRAVDAAKSKVKRYPKADGIVPGLQIIVHPTGKKTYKLSARVHGKLVSFTIGDASLMSLADARANAKAILAEIAAGGDPREAKQEAIRTATETVAVVAGRYVERHVKVHQRQWRETTRIIESEIVPAWGRRPISSISKRDVIALADKIVDRGSPIMANRVFETARRLFTWCCDRGLLEVSPCDRVKLPSPEPTRDRVHNDFELGLILRAADGLNYPHGPFIKTLVLTGQRRQEVAKLSWSELDADLSVWALPAARVKNARQHTVPIVPWVRSILLSLPRFAGSDFVFSATGGRTSIGNFSRLKLRLDAEITRLNNGVPIPGWVLHDTRRSFASGLAALGVQLPVIERALNHVGGVSFGGISGVYQRYSFSDEVRIAMETWAAHLLSLDLGSSTVVALRA
jgi:integrase